MVIADFKHFRIIPWHPRFHWEKDLTEVGIKINLPHEDYPDYVYTTTKFLHTYVANFNNNKAPKTLGIINNTSIQNIHKFIFDKDKEHTYRTCNVRVGNHIPPYYEIVPKLMDQLYFKYSTEPLTLGNIIKWYVDFETIHPFLDGNGRVGGTIVAMLSFNCFPNKGYLTTGQ